MHQNGVLIQVPWSRFHKWLLCRERRLCQRLKFAPNRTLANLRRL